MVYIVEVLIILGAIALVIWGMVRAWRALRHQHELGEPWEVSRRSLDSHTIVVEVEKPFEQPVTIAELDTVQEDFEMKLYEAEARARDVARALNPPKR